MSKKKTHKRVIHIADTAAIPCAVCNAPLFYVSQDSVFKNIGITCPACGYQSTVSGNLSRVGG